MNPSNFVSVQTAGGLGNQFFCFYAGLAASKSRDVGLLVRPGPAITWEGTRFASILDFDLTELRDVSVGKPSGLAHRLLFVAADVLATCFSPWGVYRLLNAYTSGSNDFDQRVIEDIHNPKVMLRGHFIHQFVLDFMTEECRLKKPQITDMSPRLKSAMSRMVDENPICMHIRRGDYLRPHSEQQILPTMYYIAAMADLTDEKRPVWIFTDSPEDSDVLHLQKKYDALVVSTKMTITASEEFWLLMNAETIIASNSTFSLLAVALGVSKQSRLPSYWGDNVRGLRPKGVQGVRYINPGFDDSGARKERTWLIEPK